VKRIPEMLQPGFLAFWEMDGDDIEAEFFLDASQLLKESGCLTDAFDLLLVDGRFGIAVEQSAAAFDFHRYQEGALFADNIHFALVPSEIASQDPTTN
jgi:hypothetical protein